MNYEKNGKKEQKLYYEEAKNRWGRTPSFKEYEQKSKEHQEEFEDVSNGLLEIFAEIGKMKQLPVDDLSVQNSIDMLKDYITEHFYTCTDDILSGLGEIYVADNRFKENIDHAGGPGTAEFVSKAINFYCNK